MLVSLTSLAALLVFTLMVSGQNVWSAGQAVSTTSGVIKGFASPKISGVSAYMGVPFAQPPTGPNRWLKPLPFNSTGEIQAIKQAPSCRGSMAFQSGSNIGEDCLYLNLWTAPQKGEGSKAVLVYIYGGGFETGTTAGMDGSRLADKEDVVLIAPGYRVGIFGFPDAPGLPDQNLGILDVRKALEWVRDNVANFGGDPKRIMMFGQSAGSMLLDMYSMVYVQDPIVAAIIGESGSSASGFALSNKGSKWNTVARGVGCPTGAASLECMRKKSEAEITKAVGSAGRSGVAGPFAPVVDGKTVWSNSQVASRQRQGLFAKVPYVFMVNSREVGIGDGMTFNCPANAAAAARTQHGVLAWRARFYGGGSTGHGAELPFVWGSKAGPLSDFMMNIWASFAKDPNNALIKAGWPTYKSGGQIVAIGKGSSTHAATEPASVVESGCIGGKKS